jgi:PAS domain S-box-containing protein
VIDLSRYILEALRKDADVILYRARSKDDGTQVLVLSPVAEYPTPERLRRFEHEYFLREALDPTLAARPIALTRDSERTILVLEDPGGMPLESAFGPRGRGTPAATGTYGRVGNGSELAFFLRVAISLANAIDHVHRKGIIHKDIKPANVLVNSVTGQCWLTGFGIASRLPRERQSAEPPESVAGTLAYMAPEQTGRMNRTIDSRSDLYAFGVSLYEMLTGTLPFTASDPMEWVHCHIARQPVPPNERRKDIPATVSAIIMKLLAKTAEERYQTGAGAQSDLRRCLDEWEGSRPRDPRRAGTSALPSDSEATPEAIAPFALGEHDIPDRLLIPETLYGRATEIDTLLASFDRVVASGTPELVLVSGYSGIGKSSVVNELHKALVPSRGLFASGKFDQYKRDIPYATLAQAFQSLIRPLLGKSEAELRIWRDALHEALGPNGRLIVDLVPELKLIIGEQPPVPELPPQDAQGRFQLVFRRFIGAFARPEHPLVLFLDDLQWLDAATLNLIEDLLTSDFASQPSSRSLDAEPPAQTSARLTDAEVHDPLLRSRRRLGEVGLRRAGRLDVQHLMLVGAYRDNEVDSTHPLMRKLGAIRQAGAKVQEIILAPLASEDLARLIADSLHCKVERATPLAQTVHEKTAGNPFFAIQFITALAEEGLLTFDHGAARWLWDLNRIHAKGYTDNVVDLMVRKLNRLPVETQKAMQQFACLGNAAKITTLSIIRETPEEQVHSDLWEAVRLEFIVRSPGSYKFVHDRVQEAAYSSIPGELRAEAHLRIGKLLAAHTPPEARAEAIFEIANQMNRGAALITSRPEREQLAALNLLAGERAKASTAYSSALKYLIAGTALLSDDRWDRQHELAFSLELNRAECEFLTGKLAIADERLARLAARAASTLEQATVACLRMDLYTTHDQSDRAVGVCLDYLRHLGIEWSPHPTAEEARREYEQIWIQLGSRAIEELIELPLMSDPASIATLDVLTKVLSPALFTDANFLSLAICRAVNLSLERGNSDGSCVTYVWLGMIAGPHFGNYKAGFQFGRLGYELVEQRGLNRFQARTYLWFGQFVMPWTKHVRAGRDLMRRAFEAANKVGDLTVAAYSCDALNTNLLAAGDSLSEVQLEAENGLMLAQKARFGIVTSVITAQLGLIRTLRGSTSKFGFFDDAHFSELRFERHLASEPVLALPRCWYWIRKMQARFFAGDYESAIDLSLRARRLLWTSPSLFETAEYHFYSALARAGLCESSFAKATEDKASEGQDLSFEASAKEEHFEALAEHHRQLALWAENCPENFETRVALVTAEIARIEGRVVDAEGLYEQAIHSAHANGFVHNEALANELAARFFAERGFEKIGRMYLRDARYCYLRWGATGKVRQLEELYPRLREEEPVSSLTGTIGAPIEQLDLVTVIKVSQALSGEIELGRLIDTLMRAAIEHAGAQRGLLFFPRGLGHRLEAEATTKGDSIGVRVGEASVAGAAVPESIVNYVIRTQESVILDDASTPSPFSEDPYIRQHHAHSILCLPLINQTKLIGLLYLENNLTSHVFTPKRIGVLKLLASQAAISLENTRLYRDLGEREAKIRRLVEANIIGIFIWNLEGQIMEANEAFLRMVQYSREDLLSGRLRWTDLTPAEWRERTESAVAEMKATGTVQPYEKEYFRKDGSRVPVLIGSAMFEGSGNEGAAYVLDLSERRRAEQERRTAEEVVQRMQAQLAHITRVTTLGELTASIAHEISQPLTAVVTNANASLRWLTGDSPNLSEACQSIHRIVRDGNRAGDVIARIRALFKKAPMPKESLDINELIREVLMLSQGEVRGNRVSVRTILANNLPFVMGDRIQLQQVILNLVLNAIQAIGEVADGPRELEICSEKVSARHSEPKAENSEQSGSASTEWADLLITVRDSGPGLNPQLLNRLFEPFYTTKSQGLGMGLAISRSIVEAHGGQLWAKPNVPQGAVFQFTVPVPGQRTS